MKDQINEKVNNKPKHLHGLGLTTFRSGGMLTQKIRCVSLEEVNCCSVAQLCPTICDLIDYSMPVFPVLHHLPEIAQTRVL